MFGSLPQMFTKVDKSKAITFIVKKKPAVSNFCRVDCVKPTIDNKSLINKNKISFFNMDFLALT